MNLLNHTLKYLSIALLIVMSIWAVIFYFKIIDEVRDSLDEGLKNSKATLLAKLDKDSTAVLRSGFLADNYSIREVKELSALVYKDRFRDTLMYPPGDHDREPFRMLTTAFIHQDKFYELKIISSTVEEDNLVESLLYSMLWLYAVVIVSILLINNLLIRKIWAPFYVLLERLRSFRLDQHQGIQNVATGVKEFKELNEAVSNLVEHSIQTYSSQKQFIENAAHELQTPLAISLNRLELLAEQEGLTDEHLGSISQVMRTLERLTRLNKSLLLLSKIENKQYGEVEAVSVNALVKLMAGEYDDFAAMRRVSLEVEEQGQLRSMMNKDLAVILISNLLKNAISHNIAGGKVRVLLTSASLTISNTGLPAALNPDHIFKRFKKGSTEQSSVGLGLAIVKAIVDLYSHSAEYTFDGWHHLQIHFKK